MVKEEVITLDAKNLLDKVKELLSTYGDKLHLSCITAVDEKNVIRLDYVMWIRGESKKLILRVTVPKSEAKVASISNLIPAAALYEREVFDMFGVFFEGHPRLEEFLFKPPHLKGKFPLRKG